LGDNLENTNETNVNENEEEGEMRSQTVQDEDKPTMKEQLENLLNLIEPLFKGMTKADDEAMRGDSLHAKKYVQASKKVVERFYNIMMHEPKLAFLCAMTDNSGDTNNISEACTVFTDQCKGNPTKHNYEATNAAMHCFLQGYKKLKKCDTQKKYAN
jgi:hypothetical protein